VTWPIGEASGPSSAARRDSLYRRALAVADLVAAAVALWMCIVGVGEDQLQALTLAALPIAVVVSKVTGLYDRDELTLEKSTLDEAPALFQLATLYTLVFWLSQDVFIEGFLGTRQVLALWFALFACLVVGRSFARAVAGHAAPPERCVVLGDPAACEQIGRKLAGNVRAHVQLIGWLPLDAPEDLAGAEDSFAARMRATEAHRVIIAPGEAESDQILDAVRMAKALGLKVSILPRIFEVVGSSVEFDNLEGLTVLGVRRFALTRSSLAVKWTFDRVCGIFLSVLFAPLIGLIALAIRLDSRGPILFEQTRVGRDGQLFRMLKFRTMVAGADDLKGVLLDRNEANGLFKIADDPRITRVGRLLRRTSLDELPQLMNVLRGEMSLVGPRPLVVEEDSQVAGWHRRRLNLPPGMTGPWQILGSARVPLQEMVKIDYLYAANWTLWEDVKILLRTLAHMVARRGM
jgi:exopolysaccharide biosynthesis polyprenyl glycosylphosphotransferase